MIYKLYEHSAYSKVIKEYKDFLDFFEKLEPGIKPKLMELYFSGVNESLCKSSFVYGYIKEVEYALNGLNNIRKSFNLDCKNLEDFI